MSNPETNSAAYNLIYGVMRPFIDDAVVRGILNYAFRQTDLSGCDMEKDGIPRRLIGRVEKGIDLFVDDNLLRLRCKNRLHLLAGQRKLSPSGLHLAEARTAAGK